MVPPSHFVQEILVKGSLDMLLVDITQSLKLDKAALVIYQPDGQRIRSTEELQDGQTVYMNQKVAVMHTPPNVLNKSLFCPGRAIF